MADEIVLDLEEYGEILVRSKELLIKGGVVPVSRSGERRRWISLPPLGSYKKFSMISVFELLQSAEYTSDLSENLPDSLGR